MSKHGRTSLAIPIAAAAVGVLIGVFMAKATRTEAVPEVAKEVRNEPVTALVEPSIKMARATRPLQETLQRERQLASVDVAEFPRLLEDELRNATDSGLAFKIAARWAERDPDSFLVWMQHSRGKHTLREAGHGLGLMSTLTGQLAKEDPERAWEVAGKLPGRSAFAQSYILLGLLKDDPDRAVELVRAHRVEISLRNDSHWGSANPLSLQPILDELIPGPARRRMVQQATRHYKEEGGNPTSLAESVEWYAKLPPELQKVARDAATDGFSLRKRPADDEKLLKAWEEVASEP